MTASNPPLRWVARWMMRTEAAGSQLRIIYFGGIFVATGVSALRQYGHGDYAWPFVVAVSLGTLAFAWAYTELGVWNQKNRDAMDSGSDFSGPNMYMDDKLIGAAVFAAVHGREPTGDELETIEAAVAKPWLEFRDGIDPSEVEQRQRGVIADGGDNDG